MLKAKQFIIQFILMSQFEEKNGKSQQISTLASSSVQKEDVEDIHQIQQEADGSNNSQDFLFFEQLLISILKLQEDTSLKDDLYIRQKLEFLWEDNCQACILRMHYFQQCNRMKINNNIETLQRRLRLFNIEMQPFSQNILAFLKINSENPKQMEKYVQSQEQFISSQQCSYGGIIKIYPHTRCQIKPINVQKFKENYYYKNKLLSRMERIQMIQSLKQRRFQSLKKFLRYTQLEDVQNTNSQQKNIDRKIILNERTQTQINLGFKDIKQLLQIYRKSLEDKQFNQFFYLQPYNQIQNRIIQINTDSVNGVLLEIERVLDNNGQLFKLRDQLQTAGQIGQKQANIQIQEEASQFSASGQSTQNDKNTQPQDQNKREGLQSPKIEDLFQLFEKISQNNSKREDLLQLLQRILTNHPKIEELLQILQKILKNKKGLLESLQKILKINLKIQQNEGYVKSIRGSPGVNNGIYNIQDINGELAKSNIFKLKSWMNENFMEAIVDMVKNYQVYAGLKENIRRFIGINEYKWYHAKDLYQAIYPQMLPQIRYFYRKTGIRTIQQELDQFINESPREQQRDNTNIQRLKKQFLKRKRLQLGIEYDHFLDKMFEEYSKMEQDKNKYKQRSSLEISSLFRYFVSNYYKKGEFNNNEQIKNYSSHRKIIKQQ